LGFRQLVLLSCLPSPLNAGEGSKLVPKVDVQVYVCGMGVSKQSPQGEEGVLSAGPHFFGLCRP